MQMSRQFRNDVRILEGVPPYGRRRARDFRAARREGSKGDICGSPIISEESPIGREFRAFLSAREAFGLENAAGTMYTDDPAAAAAAALSHFAPELNSYRYLGVALLKAAATVLPYLDASEFSFFSCQRALADAESAENPPSSRMAMTLSASYIKFFLTRDTRDARDNVGRFGALTLKVAFADYSRPTRLQPSRVFLDPFQRITFLVLNR